MNIAVFCCSLALLFVAVDSQDNQFGVIVERENVEEDIADVDSIQTSEETAGSERFTANPARQTDAVSSASSSSGMNKLIYEIVADEEEDAIENAFETAALKTTALKTKLDMKIDETILKLQSLKNLRRHIEKAYKFADKFISSKVTNEVGRRYVLAELQKSIDQVEGALNNSSKKEDNVSRTLKP